MVTAEEIMSKKVVCIGSDETIARTIAKMERSGAKELPIVDKGNRFQGMVFSFF